MRRVLGDFQTPDPLAHAVCRLLERHIPVPRRVVDPTCGIGGFLRAARQRWPGTPAVGHELQPKHIATARTHGLAVFETNAFDADWSALLCTGDLVLGNPPWVMQDVLGREGHAGAPRMPGRTRGDPRTGAGNFDAAEWLLRCWLEALAGRDATVAMLVKESVAIRVLAAIARDGLGARPLGMWGIDARAAFGVSAPAVLLALRTTGRPEGSTIDCPSAPDLDTHPTSTVRIVDDVPIADLDAWERSKTLTGTSPIRWRSGVKHDCAMVFELDAAHRNGHGTVVDIEAQHCFPLAKGGDVAAGRPPSRWIVVPHRAPQEPTEELRRSAPATWRYLETHATRLDARRSRIWRGGPRFGLYGIGPYSFAPYKVAVACLYAPPRFRLLEPVDGRPVLVDDTTAFLPFQDRAAATAARDALSASTAADWFAARIFPSAKRPVTIRLLSGLAWDRMQTVRPRDTP